MPEVARPYTEKYFRAACLRVLGPDSPDPSRIDRIVNAVALRAENGDVSSLIVLRDTLDGKPAQELTGANGGPISLEFRIAYEASNEARVIEHEPQMGLETAQEAQQGPENGG